MSMKRVLISLAAATVVTLVGCASQTHTSNGYAQAGALPAIQLDTKQGALWQTLQGQALYTFAKDVDGHSHCYGGCAAKWPPFLADEYAQAKGDFTLVSRNDGSRQWRYKDQPLYSWIKDRLPGQVSGHGVKNVWFAARADEVPVKVFNVQQQKVLTDLQQMALYTFDKDSAGQSNCYQKCAQLWPPLLAQAGAEASAPFSLVTRKDGTYQWALNGQPLYRWIKDQQAGDISGDGVKGVWHLATLP